MAKKVKKEVKDDDTKLFAFLATFLSIIGFVIALIAKKENKYVRFYAKQSLIVFIVGLIAGIISWVFIGLPIIGWIINLALNIIILILWIVSWIYALSGEMREVPVVGIYARKINL